MAAYLCVVYSFALAAQPTAFHDATVPVHYASIVLAVCVCALHGCFLAALARASAAMQMVPFLLVVSCGWAIDEWTRTIGSWGLALGQTAVTVVGTPFQVLLPYGGTLGTTAVVALVAAVVARAPFRIGIAVVAAVALATFPDGRRAVLPAEEQLTVVSATAAPPHRPSARLAELIGSEGSIRSADDAHRLDPWRAAAGSMHLPIALGAIVTTVDGRTVNAAIFDDPLLGHGVYVKRQRVPLGEFNPLSDLLRPYLASDTFRGEVSAGTQPAPVLASGAGLLICYEAEFERYVAELVDAHAQHIVVLASDSWFTGDFGRRQVMRSMQTLAIEFGVDVAVVRDSGPSSVLHSDGSMDSDPVTLDIRRRSRIAAPLRAPSAAAVLFAFLCAGASLHVRRRLAGAA
jgi:apolipoprotein N-acyltransferase